MTRYLITAIAQVGGGSRELYAASRRDQREAQEELRRDPAIVDYLDGVAEIVDVDRSGRRTIERGRDGRRT